MYKAFAQLGEDKGDLLQFKLMYIGCCMVGVALSMYKCNSLGGILLFHIISYKKRQNLTLKICEK